MPVHPPEGPRTALVEVAPSDPRAQEAIGRYATELSARLGVTLHPSPDTDPTLRTWVVLSEPTWRDAVGCASVREIVTLDGARAAEVKRMWLDPAMRGRGLGAQLLATVEQASVLRGHERILLDTHGSLTAAIALYERAGYRRIERYNDNPHAQVWLGKRLASPDR